MVQPKISRIRLAILGTRGIPNNYGVFEQFAQYLSYNLDKVDYDVYVYNSHNHPYQDVKWKGVNIIHKYDPEYAIGATGQFVYDLNCILDCHRRGFDIVFQLGYTSSAIWGVLLPRSSMRIINMDGLEWKRAKHSKLARYFLRFSERLAVISNDLLISDSLGIKNYIYGKYRRESIYIPYGANVFDRPNSEILESYNVSPHEYNILIARLEPENNIETILAGVETSNSRFPFLVIGKTNTKHGKYLLNRFQNNKQIRFLGGIYNQSDLDNFRYFSNLYFHGHSVGGTNPSLLEAMGCRALIVAHDNIFNRSILNLNAHYFKSEKDVIKCLDIKKEDYQEYLENNLLMIQNKFSWDTITRKYDKLFKASINRIS